VCVCESFAIFLIFGCNGRSLHILSPPGLVEVLSLPAALFVRPPLLGVTE